MSGLENIRRILGSDVSAASNKDKKIFIECLACAGGCINGPVMPEESDSLANIIRTSVDYRNENSCDRNYDLDIHERFSVSVINDNDITYLVTLLNGCLVTVYECNFNLGQLDLIMGRKIPPIVISGIIQDKTIRQEDGIRKIFNLVMNSEYKIQLESTKIDNFNFREQETFPSALYLNQNSEITTASFLTEGTTTYNIENTKTIEGLPFVPDTGETYSNIITLKTDTPNNRGFVIQNGYISKERPDLYRKNCRVKTLKVIYPNIESPFEQIVTLKDDTFLQFVPFMWNLLDDCKEVQIVIDSVYQGTKYDDVCINYIGLVTQTPVEISER
jgi:hypothetical protein